DWVEQLSRFHPLLVNVTAALETLEQRERQRGNEPGLARGHFPMNVLCYSDLLLDTTHRSPQASTEALLGWLATQPTASAVWQFNQSFGPPSGWPLLVGKTLLPCWPPENEISSS